MILGTNLEQDEMICCIQEGNWLSYFWSYLPLFFKLILCPLCNISILCNNLMICGRNVEQDETTCCIQE